MPSLHDERRAPYERHEYVSGPAPYALPEAAEDDPAAEPTRQTGRGRRVRAPGRTLRGFLGLALSVVLMSAFGFSMVASSDPRLLLVRDSFDRSTPSGSANDWGKTDNDRPWLYPSNRFGFRLSSGQGVMELRRAGSRQRALINTRVRDLTMRYSFSLNRMPGGNGARVSAVVRQSAAGEYRLRVRIGRGGRVWLSVAKERWGGRTKSIGRPVMVGGWRYSAGQTVNVVMQAIKTDPTQLRMKAWPNGSNEPSRWQLIRNDNSDDVDLIGRVGFFASLTPNATNAPVQVRFDNLRVNRAGDARRLGTVSLAAPKKKQVQDAEPTPVADNRAPVIKSVEATQIGASTATIEWSLDEPATGFVRYGTSRPYSDRTVAEESFRYSTHVQNINGLQPDTTYNFAVVSTDRAGNKRHSKNYTFTTTAAPGGATSDATPVPEADADADAGA